jgi:hypothetical protein
VTPARSRRSLGFDYFAERASQVGLREHLARFRHAAAREEQFCACGPWLEHLSSPFDVDRTQLIDGDSLGQLNSRLDNFGQRFRPEAIERCNNRIEYRWNRRRKNAR